MRCRSHTNKTSRLFLHYFIRCNYLSVGIVDIFFQSAEHSPCFPVYKLCTHTVYQYFKYWVPMCFTWTQGRAWEWGEQGRAWEWGEQERAPWNEANPSMVVHEGYLYRVLRASIIRRSTNPSRNSVVCIGLARNGGICRLCFVMNIYCLLQLSPLHMAAGRGDMGEVKRLVSEGEDINIKDSGSGVSMHVWQQF